MNGNGTYSFVVSTARTTANKVASRESGANRPRLVVTTSTAGPTASPTASPTGDCHGRHCDGEPDR